MTDRHTVPDRRPDTGERVASDRLAGPRATGEPRVLPADASITAAMRTHGGPSVSVIEWTVGGVPR